MTPQAPIRPRPRALAVLAAGALSLLALGANAPGQGAPDDVTVLEGRFIPYPMYVRTFANGMRAVVVPTESAGMFSMLSVVGTGSRDEVEPGLSGFAHFFEHMMFRGTERYPADRRNALLAQLGVDDGGYTTDDFTAYESTGPAASLAKVLELEADRFRNLSYSIDVFKTESKAVLGEYNKNYANPDRKAWEALRNAAFDVHTYKHTTMGFLDDIKAMPTRYEYSKRFFSRFYTPDNVVLFLAGDVVPDEVFPLIEEHFGPWSGTREKTAVKAEPAQTAERRADVAWDTPILSRGHVAWRVPSSADNPTAAAATTVLETYLLNQSSPLHRELVLEKGLVESIQSWWVPHKDAALFPINWKVKEGKNNDEVLGRVQAAVDNIAAGNVDAARFEAVKSNLRYGVLMGLTSPADVAGTLGYYSGHAMDPAAPDRLLAGIADLEVSDLVALAKNHLSQAQRTVVTVTPKGGAK